MGRSYEGKVVWITGGGSGIGEALAIAFAHEGANVAVSGRRVEKLQATCEKIERAGVKALAVQCDVSEEEAVRAAVEQVVEAFGRLDVAIANAGFGVGGKLEVLSAADWRRQFDTNVVGLAMTAKHALPELKKTGGRVVLMGSVAGTVAMPGNGAYHASKYAVRAIGQTLSLELIGSGVSCTTIQPGFVESEIGQVDNEGKFREDWQDRRPQKFMWSAERAARVCLDAITEREREFTFTGHGKILAALGKHVPGAMYSAFAGYKQVNQLIGGKKGSK